MFFLDRPASKEPTFIFLRLKCSDGRLKYPVKKKVLPTEWTGSATNNDKATNLLLSKIEGIAKSLLLQRDLTGIPLTKAVAQATLDKALGRELHGKKFFEVVDMIIDDREAGRELTPRGKRFSWHTIKGYRHSRNNLYRFCPSMTFESVTMKMYDDLVAFFYKEKEHSLNALGKTIKNWKAFMKAAHKRGLHNNLIYAHEDFRVPGEDTDDVYLSPRELDIIYNHHFPNKTLDICRDWFIIDCYTGLRISDIMLLSREHVHKDRLELMNEKTDTRVAIPLNSQVRSILKKWKGLPPKLTDQEMNRSIKQVCELAAINEPVLYSITKGGVRRDYFYKKYEMVSNHTARRSFITNLLNAGIPDNQVMQLAGIKKHGTLMKYKKTKPEETAKLLAGHSFFK